MKNILAFAFLTSVVCAAAQDYSGYYTDLPVAVEAAAMPAIPDNSVTLTDFGAVGDGLTLNTEAFAQAVEALTKLGGGHLNVPFGLWLTGPIVLRDNIDLHLDKNAIIYFSPDKSLYTLEEGKSQRCAACISANRARNITITGEGIIDGNGAQWRPVKRGKVSDVEWKNFKQMGGVEADGGNLWYPYNLKGQANITDDAKRQEGMRNDLVRFMNCENIAFVGVTFQNSPRFHVHPLYCKNVVMDGITVRCPWNAQNGDAIDISDCHRVLIVNCTVDAGDDGLCMKSGGYKEGNLVNGCSDILIENNTVYHAHGGFVIGSESVTSMKNIVVRNCRMAGTDTGLRFKSGIGRGGKTEKIYIDNIVMTDIVDEAIIFQCNYENKAAGRENDPSGDTEVKFVPEFTDIHISNVVSRGSKTGIAASGIEGKRCVHGISIKDSYFGYTKNASVITPTAEVELENVRLENLIKK